jgi:hypothetical protein
MSPTGIAHTTAISIGATTTRPVALIIWIKKKTDDKIENYT